MDIMFSSFISFQNNYNSYKYEPRRGDSKIIVAIPMELLVQIFSNLNPRDLAHCSLVSNEFNTCVNQVSVWKSLYQRFVPIFPDTKADASTYKKAVQIIYLHFGYLQKKLAATGEFVIKKNDDERACSCIFRDAIKNRIFFFAHALLEMLDTKQMSWAFCWDFSSKMQSGTMGVLSFALSNSPELTKDILADLGKLYAHFIAVVKKQNHAIEYPGLTEAIESLFDAAITDQNVNRLHSIQTHCSNFFPEERKKSALLYTLTCLVKMSLQTHDPEKIETAKFITRFEPKNEILSEDLRDALEKEDIARADSILSNLSNESLSSENVLE